jgi:hypothetical protein
MRRTVLFLAVWSVALLGLCSFASAGILGVAEVDYQYHAGSQGGAWTKVADPGYGAPEWFKVPFSDEQWVSIPNQQRLDKVKYLWLQVEWDNQPQLPPNPVAWAPQDFSVTGGTNPTFIANGHPTYVWQWVITPQPKAEFIEFPLTFPWNGVVGIDVATRCVPEPSVLVGLGSMGLVGLFLLWRRRR